MALNGKEAAFVRAMREEVDALYVEAARALSALPPGYVPGPPVKYPWHRRARWFVRAKVNDAREWLALRIAPWLERD